MMLAGATKNPELAFTVDESERMAAAIANVSRHYNVQVAEKTMDWVNLSMCLGSVYGGKFMAIKLRKKAERSARHATEATQGEAKQPDIHAPVAGVSPIDLAGFGNFSPSTLANGLSGLSGLSTDIN